MGVIVSQRPVKLRFYWSFVAVPLICPTALLPLVAVAMADQLWAQIFFGLVAAYWFKYLDGRLRGALNQNVDRIDSALEAFEAASRGDQPVALLLRSFGQVHGYHDVSTSFSLFELIVPALRATGFRPCAIGTALPLPPRHGVALVESTEADWWKHFEVLAAGAAVIIVLPESSASLMREVDALRASECLAKTVLLMPPRSIGVLGGTDVAHVAAGGDDRRRRERWSTARSVWDLRFGIALPGYDERGALIELGGSGEVEGVTILRPGDTDDSMRALSQRHEEGRYRADYAVPFERLWAELLARRRFRGPPIREVWRRLRPGAPAIGLRSYWRPPGDNGRLRRNVAWAALAGWLPPFLVALLSIGHMIFP
jgi:hypothetical protein